MKMKGKKIIAPILCLASVATLAACSPVVTDGDNLNDFKTEHVEVVNANQKLELSVASLNTELATLKNELETYRTSSEADAATIAEKEAKIKELEAEIEKLNADEEYVWVNTNETNEIYQDEFYDYMQNITLNGGNNYTYYNVSSASNESEINSRYILVPNEKIYESGFSSSLNLHYVDLNLKNNYKLKFKKDLVLNPLIINIDDIQAEYVGNKEVDQISIDFSQIILEVYNKENNNCFHATTFHVESSNELDFSQVLKENDLIDMEKYDYKIKFNGSINGYWYNNILIEATYHEDAMWQYDQELIEIISSTLSLDEEGKTNTDFQSLDETKLEYLKSNYDEIGLLQATSNTSIVDLEYVEKFGPLTFDLSEELPNYTFVWGPSESSSPTYCFVVKNKEGNKVLYRYAMTVDGQPTFIA